MHTQTLPALSPAPQQTKTLIMHQRMPAALPVVEVMPAPGVPVSPPTVEGRKRRPPQIKLRAFNVQKPGIQGCRAFDNETSAIPHILRQTYLSLIMGAFGFGLTLLVKVGVYGHAGLNFPMLVGMCAAAAMWIGREE